MSNTVLHITYGITYYIASKSMIYKHSITITPASLKNDRARTYSGDSHHH